MLYSHVCSFSSITSHGNRFAAVREAFSNASIEDWREEWNCGTIAFEETTRNGVRIFWLNSFLCWKKVKGIAGFNMTGRRPTLRTQLLYCKISLASALLGVAFGHRDLQLHFFLWGFLKEGVYLINPRSFEELKYNTEHTVANNDAETLRKVARNILTKKGGLQKDGGHFQHLL
jgi:hypothetical protein